MGTKKKPQKKATKKSTNLDNHWSEQGKKVSRKKHHPRPRSRRLPGMEDAGIQELESLAEDMADVIAEKKEKMADEKNLNEQLVAAMKKHGRITYSHRGISINLSTTDKAKVVIKDDDTDDTPADNTPAPAPKVSVEAMAANSEG